MSKIGKINISIPEKVKVALAGNIINIEGPLGKKSINVDLDMFNLDIIEGKESSIKPKKVTLLSASSIEKDLRLADKVNKTELSKLVAQKLAKKAQEKKITKIYFDRGSYKYHGRIKVFAETLRENGMEF